MIEQLRNTLQMTAESLAPSITLQGLADPETLHVNPEKYSEMLDIRLQVEWAIAEQARQANKNIAEWTFADGLYGRYDDSWDRKISKGEQPLCPEEIAIAQSIDRSLEEQVAGAPVIALDFGGGMGLSWMRIAAQPKYRAAIEESRLAMVVTNLGSIPEKKVDAEGYSGIPLNMKYSNESYSEYTDLDLRWAQENQGYVQYLDANSLELPDTTIYLADGTTVPLKGGVAMIYEKLALEHSHVPDLALMCFNELLSSHGVLRSRAAVYYHLMHSVLFPEIVVDSGEVVSVTAEYAYQRRLGLVIGSTALKQAGFSYEVEESEGMGIFRRSPNVSRA